MKKIYKIISLFSGCGGLDLGFEITNGFKIIWANEKNKRISDTYRLNFPATTLDTRNIKDINIKEIPDCDGIIGGPPCQPFSRCGNRMGTDDPRGMLFIEFIRIVEGKKPMFFVFENVPMMMSKKHKATLNQLIDSLSHIGFDVKCNIINVSDYGIAQSRRRLFIIGIRKDIGKAPSLHTNSVNKVLPNLHSVIIDLQGKENVAMNYKTTSPKINAHEHVHISKIGLSRWFMYGQRVRGWSELSYTIPASISSIPFHPSCPKLIRSNDKIYSKYTNNNNTKKCNRFKLVDGFDYRKLTVRECARIQGFPDTFKFIYNSISIGHLMVGNAVPPPVALFIAKSIYMVLQ